jgi:hypothetical protein
MNNILIIFPSWEERSLLGLKKDIEQLSMIQKVVLLKFKDSAHPEKIGETILQMQNVCDKHGIQHEPVEISRHDVDGWHTLDDFVKTMNADDVYMDITTMPRSIIWTLLFFFRQKYSQITVTYHPAKQYSDDWLSKDPDIPQLLFKHSGIIDLGKPTSLLVLTGYDPERVIQLINYFEPQNIILREQPGNIRNAPKQYGIFSNIKIFQADERDASWGYDTLKFEIEEALISSNLIVASLGPKTGAISVYQCFMKYPQIALAYVPCKEFNIDYCKGIGDTFVKKVIFENQEFTNCKWQTNDRFNLRHSKKRQYCKTN